MLYNVPGAFLDSKNTSSGDPHSNHQRQKQIYCLHLTYAKKSSDGPSTGGLAAEFSRVTLTLLILQRKTTVGYSPVPAAEPQLLLPNYQMEDLGLEQHVTSQPKPSCKS